jgi:hypothetical protein
MVDLRKMRGLGLEVANICVPSEKFPWVGCLLSKDYSNLHQDCAVDHQVVEEGEQVYLG